MNDQQGILLYCVLRVDMSMLPDNSVSSSLNEIAYIVWITENQDGNFNREVALISCSEHHAKDLKLNASILSLSNCALAILP